MHLSSVRGAKSKLKGLYFNSVTLFAFKKIQSLKNKLLFMQFLLFFNKFITFVNKFNKNKNDYTKF
ncbi:MAG TPA: hypothetical protein DER08_08980 [Flavobacterium sp.]|nr:MAG: hypothetical protein A2X21_09275 [Flavobacteria bacterium GWA2_35_26]HCF04465.1 hypothetical protein [Flavobacterium sp.]